MWSLLTCWCPGGISVSSHPSWLVSVLRPWDPVSLTTFTCSCSSFEWFFTCFLAI